MAAIFISHSSKDNELAEAMKQWLLDQGHSSLFLDFDKDIGLHAGSEWEELFGRLSFWRYLGVSPLMQGRCTEEA